MVMMVALSLTVLYVFRSSSDVGPDAPPRRLPPRDAAKRPDPLVGWRYWRLADLRLVSHSQPEVWAIPVEHLADGTPVFSAQCERCNPPPGDGCTCGFYAHKSAATAVAEGKRLYRPPVAIGRVALGGKVIEYREHFRAEKAALLALYIPDEMARDPQVRQVLASTYGAAVLPLSELDKHSQKLSS
jgi:hypothetical protein